MPDNPKSPAIRKGRTDEWAWRMYEYIVAYQAEHHRPPTIAETAAGCFMSRSSALRYLDLLEKRGLLWREEGIARGITVLQHLETPPEYRKGAIGEKKAKD